MVVKSDLGTLELANPALGALVIRMTGRMELEHAQAICEYGESTVHQNCRMPNAFLDLYEMDGFDTECRLLLTDWTQAQSPGPTHILLGTRVVALGVAMASMALTLFGLAVSTYTSANGFETKLSDYVQHNRS
ncbi:MAG: hypothetical protein ACI9KE_006133 [Polyangiales bacterium]|jgi:hypothetical protein